MRPILFLALVGCNAMKVQAVEKATDDLWVNGNTDMVAESYAPELVPQVLAFYQDTKADYPDIHVSVDKVVVHGTDFATLWTVKGTHATYGQKVEVKGITYSRYEGGKFVEERVVWDQLPVIEALGYTVMEPGQAEALEQRLEKAEAKAATLMAQTEAAAEATDGAEVAAE